MLKSGTVGATIFCHDHKLLKKLGGSHAPTLTPLLLKVSRDGVMARLLGTCTNKMEKTHIGLSVKLQL